MNNIQNIGKIFNYRHDFDSDDLIVLQNNFKDVKFNNIPEAWIILIDKMLLRLKNNDIEVKSVSQYFGFLVVDFLTPFNEKSKIILEKYEKKFYSVDADLH